MQTGRRSQQPMQTYKAKPLALNLRPDFLAHLRRYGSGIVAQRKRRDFYALVTKLANLLAAFGKWSFSEQFIANCISEGCGHAL